MFCEFFENPEMKTPSTQKGNNIIRFRRSPCCCIFQGCALVIANRMLLFCETAGSKIVEMFCTPLSYLDQSINPKQSKYRFSRVYHVSGDVDASGKHSAVLVFQKVIFSLLRSHNFV